LALLRVRRREKEVKEVETEFGRGYEGGSGGWHEIRSVDHGTPNIFNKVRIEDHR
jgi:hypothetical protein